MHQLLQAVYPQRVPLLKVILQTTILLQGISIFRIHDGGKIQSNLPQNVASCSVFIFL